jgi:hypothetical protein
MKKSPNDTRHDRPHGILFLYDPEYADLIPAQERFVRLADKAEAEGRLFVPEHLNTLH